MASISDNTVKVVRKPGRPKTIDTKKSLIEKKGIIQNPLDKTDAVEFRYTEPLIFKLLWNYFKHMNIENLHIIFRAKDVIIYGIDHSQKNSIYVKINVPMVNIYYCKQELHVGISLKTSLAYINTIDKNTKFIEISSKLEEQKSIIMFVFCTELASLEAHKINLISEYETLTQETEKEFLNLDDYKISMKFPSKFLKKKMNDISLCKTTTVDFVQDGKGEPFTIMYESADKCGSSRIPFKVNDKINFKSGLTDDETFRITVLLDNLKSISTAGFTNDVELFMSENKSILFKTKLDDVIELKILTQILKD